MPDDCSDDPGSGRDKQNVTADGDESGKGPRPLSKLEEYDLKIDEQVQNFLEVGQRLAFYVVTAAVGSLGYTLTHAATNGVHRWLSFSTVLLAGIVTLVTVACVLLSLWYQIASYRMHLSCRTSRSQYEDLSTESKAKWNLVNRRSISLQRAAFVGLTLGIVFQTTYFASVLMPREAVSMHHFGEDSTWVIERDDDFLIIAKNKITNRAVTITIPKEQILETPGGVVDHAKAERLAGEIAHVLRRELN
jgi:hypothetical protein